MNTDLTDTNSSGILAALTRARRNSGSAALGMVLTLVVDVEERGHHDSWEAARDVAREHPCRILSLIRRPSKGAPRLDAEIRVGHDGAQGETIVLRLYGSVRRHAASVVLPLLLPDAPVVVWWPGAGPEAPAQDPVGHLAQRRVTDAAAGSSSMRSLEARKRTHEPGDTDLAWTRLTPWRTLLAAALDQPWDRVTGAEVSGARGNPSAELLASWLETRLHVPAERHTSRGPGITAVRLHSERGEIALTRPDGRLATLSRPGRPDRAVALHRRGVSELLAEELRRLDPDEVYAETLQAIHPAPPRSASHTNAARSTTKRAATKRQAVKQPKSKRPSTKNSVANDPANSRRRGRER